MFTKEPSQSIAQHQTCGLPKSNHSQVNSQHWTIIHICSCQRDRVMSPMVDNMQVPMKHILCKFWRTTKHLKIQMWWVWCEITLYECPSGLSSLPRFEWRCLNMHAWSNTSETRTLAEIYVDNTFILWCHNHSELDSFLDYIDSQWPTIHAIHEGDWGKQNTSLLDVLVTTDKWTHMFKTQVYHNPMRAYW